MAALMYFKPYNCWLFHISSKKSYGSSKIYKKNDLAQQSARLLLVYKHIPPKIPVDKHVCRIIKEK